MLRDEAMVVRLSISQWTARKFDRSVSRRVASAYGTGEDAGRYNKVLIAQDAIKQITKVVSAVRTYHYESTLPWDNFGGRLLPTAMFAEYSKKMREYTSDFETAVKEFIENYDAYRDEARERLNGMFDPTDYPSPDAIKRKYDLSVGYEPVPDSGDFRVDIGTRDMERIKKTLDSSIGARETEMLKDMYRRLHEVVSHMADKLGDSDNIFRDSLVENVVELAGILPKLNVMHDPKLEKLSAEVKSKLGKYEPQQLREDVKARQKAHDDAQAILKKMAAYVG